MAITTKNLLTSKYWREPREYSKAEALLYLINRPPKISIRGLAKVWQWDKSKVSRFIEELKKEKLWDSFWDTLRDTNNIDRERVIKNSETPSETLNETHNNKYNYYPPILSSTKVESNIIPPRGEREVNPDYLKFLDWLKSNAPRVLQMKEPITEKQFISLKTDFDTQFLCDLLREMHNYEPLLKKNRSANLTLRNWAKRRKQWDNGNTKSTTNQASDTESRITNVLKAAARGYARAHTPQEWQN